MMMASQGILWAGALLCVCKFGSAYVETVDASAEVVQPRSEPQVAMVCNKDVEYYNQYMNSAGHWGTDRDNSKGCLQNKEDILGYCKTLYPKLEITNIVESSQQYTIDNWCKVGHETCQESYWIRPYRCLEGKFQSDSLLVPEPCQFDHIRNGSWCWDFSRWNGTAKKACRDRGMYMKSFAMLVPCGTDLFTGVEFVCCPEEDEAVNKPIEKNYPPQLTSEINIDAEEITLEPKQDAEDTTRDPYFTRFDPRVEHDAFRAAEKRLETSHQRKVKRVMKKWAELEEQYQKLKATNAVEADKFKLRMTGHFQKLMNHLKDKVSSDKEQLIALHQQRIVAHINERKKEARACYIRALNESPPQTSAVHKCLNRLIRALYKDRHHSITHFRHLLATDPATASLQQVASIEHLRDVDMMVNDSIQMLDRFPTIKLKILPELSQTAAELRRQDSTPAELVAGVTLDAAGEIQDLVSKAADDQVARERILTAEQRQRDQKLEAHREARAELRRVEQAAGHPVDDFDPETMENEAVLADKNDEDADDEAGGAAVADRHIQPLTSHVQTHEHTQGEATFRMKRPAHSGGGRGLYFTVALASIALTVALVAGAFTLRRRQRAPRNLGFVEVDQAGAPEEPHVAQMQVNGYENPTYRYFENK